MEVTGNDTYMGYPLYPIPGTSRICGWWRVEELGLHLKVHGRWRAEIWHDPDPLTKFRLRIFDHTSGAEWLDAGYPRGTTGVTPYLRADAFMAAGKMPGWGEWPTEPTSHGRVPMPPCHYCTGPVSRAELLVLATPPNDRHLYPELAGWDPRAHRSCHAQHHAQHRAEHDADREVEHADRHAGEGR